jgi:hypothetical protein
MKKFFLVLLVLLVVAAAVGFLLPHDYRVEESVVINAKPSRVHDLVGDLKRWDEWTPWKEMDPTVQVTFGTATKGVGASQTWTGKDGAGSLTFTASDEDKGIEYEMKFDEMPAKGAIRYERMGDGTKVTWSMSGDMEMPVVGGYFALLMPRMVGGSFEKGLSKLKSEVEK